MDFSGRLQDFIFIFCVETRRALYELWGILTPFFVWGSLICIYIRPSSQLSIESPITIKEFCKVRQAPSLVQRVWPELCLFRCLSKHWIFIPFARRQTSCIVAGCPPATIYDSFLLPLSMDRPPCKASSFYS